jgi:hypothetical protein
MENENLEPIGELNLAEPNKYENCEWVFQFDEDEPQIFAWTGEDIQYDKDPTVNLTLNNTENSFIQFKHKNGKTFKLFARELSEEGKSLRDLQNKEIELLKQSLENESENKEA